MKMQLKTRITAVLLAAVIVISLTGCSIRNSHATAENVLVESTDDETVWVDDGTVTSKYSETEKVLVSKGGTVSSGQNSRPDAGEEPETPVPQDYKQKYQSGDFGSEAGYTLKISDYVRNIGVWSPKYLFGNSFKIDSGINTTWGSGPLNRQRAVNSVQKYNLGSDQVQILGDVREWGYNFFMSANEMSGNGSRPGGGGFYITPTSRKVAMQMLEKGIFDLYNIDVTKPWESCPGHFLWQHYSCEWGADSIGSEIGEGISSTQTHIAFSRGAARQYGLPWFSQFSFWGIGGYIADFTGLSAWGEKSSPVGGHSASLYRRSFLANYMGGASHFYPEAGLTINFTSKEEGDCYELSPVGKMTQQLQSFTERNKNVGINYIPFGIVLDYYHGIYPGDYTTAPKRAFQVFRYNSGDQMSFDLLDMFFPNSWNVKLGNEENYHVNGPYGDTCDVLLQNASQDVLNSYPALILSGDIALSAEEVNRYKAYVKQGGTLILNTAYLKFFPEYNEKYNGQNRLDLKDGKGTVIVFGPDFSLEGIDEIIREQLKKYIPFTFSEDVEYMVNVKNGSLIVTVINNSGYQYSHYLGGEKVDISKTVDLTVKYTGNLKVKSAKELWSGKALTASAEQRITLPPGDAQIIEFNFG